MIFVDRMIAPPSVRWRITLSYHIRITRVPVLALRYHAGVSQNGSRRGGHLAFEDNPAGQLRLKIPESNR